MTSDDTLSASTSKITRGAAVRLIGVPPCCALRCELAWGGPARRSCKPPGHRLAATQGFQGRIAVRHGLGHGPAFAPQRHVVGVAREAVEIRTVEAGEAFELVER